MTEGRYAIWEDARLDGPERANLAQNVIRKVKDDDTYTFEMI